ncbi:LD-carboxypeptidase [Chlorobium sp. KB01]|uniref:S66 peptidase family protein n=1 Tax=Chlorobium sp. KB01 TaxID=1917528 RepID=UPI0009783A0D|nr:LD-carboxypeptidase [Chlorobium sp. KB01]
MKNLIPKALCKGETIGLISPSSHCAYPVKIGQAISYLETNGYRVKLSSHLNRIDTDPAVADREKLHDIHEMFSDPDVRAIFCLRGGAGSARLLNQLDYTLIAANPKILAGYSDITALSLALYAKTGLVSFSGPMAATELYAPTPYTEEHFWGMLTSPSYAHSITNHSAHPISAIKKGSAEGQLIGGNLSVLSAMIGTPFLPLFNDTLLFLEDINEPAYRIDRMLSHLSNAGLLARCCALLFGQFSSEPLEPGEAERVKNIFDYYSTLNPDATALSGLSYGHIRDLMTIPIGARFRVSVTASGSFTLGALEPVIAT